jgi:hypothetical protein
MSRGVECKGVCPLIISRRSLEWTDSVGWSWLGRETGREGDDICLDERHSISIGIDMRLAFCR